MEAVKIGLLVRKYLLEVQAPIRSPDGSEVFLPNSSYSSPAYCKQPDPSCVCIDACAIIFLGGVVRTGHIGFKSLLNPAGYTLGDYTSRRQEINRYLEEIEATQYVKAQAFLANETVHWIYFEDSSPPRATLHGKMQDVEFGRTKRSRHV